VFAYECSFHFVPVGQHSMFLDNLSRTKRLESNLEQRRGQIFHIITTQTAPIPVHTAHANALPVSHMGFEVLITEKQEGTLF